MRHAVGAPAFRLARSGPLTPKLLPRTETLMLPERNAGPPKGNSLCHRVNLPLRCHVDYSEASSGRVSATDPRRGRRTAAPSGKFAGGGAIAAAHSGREQSAVMHETRIPPDDSRSSVRCNVVIISTNLNAPAQATDRGGAYLDARRHRVHSGYHCPASARGGGLRL